MSWGDDARDGDAREEGADEDRVHTSAEHNLLTPKAKVANPSKPTQTAKKDTLKGEDVHEGVEDLCEAEGVHRPGRPYTPSHRRPGGEKAGETGEESKKTRRRGRLRFATCGTVKRGESPTEYAKSGVPRRSMAAKVTAERKDISL